MQKVVINGDYLAFNTFAGVSRFATEILAELDLMVKDLKVELLTPEYVESLPKFKNIKTVKFGQQPILKWKNTALPQYVKKQEALLVDLTQAFPFGVKGITCVHDCIPELVSTAYSGVFGKLVKKPLKLVQRRAAIKNSVAVITVSEFSKKDIARLYHVNPEKITVVGNAWQHIEKTAYDDTIINKYNLETKKFYFSLGSRVEHKNLKWIVSAALQNPESVFVVSGENSYSKGFDESQFPKNIIFTGYISDGEIRSLMANCKAFILPSIYEGFGIPPMEALAENAQIIVSNTSCLPEIYRKSAHYIDPYQLENIDLDKILAEHVEDLEAVLNKYSWEKSAKTLYSLICRCMR